MIQRKESFKNFLGKGENVGNQHFLPFPKYFQSYSKQISIFESHLSFSSANALSLDQPEILWDWKGLKKKIHSLFLPGIPSLLQCVIVYQL